MQENSLQKEMATHSSILAWETPWTRSLEGCSPWGCKELATAYRLNNNYYLFTKFLSAFSHKLFLIAGYYSALEAQGEFSPLLLSNIYVYIYIYIKFCYNKLIMMKNVSFGLRETWLNPCFLSCYQTALLANCYLLSPGVCFLFCKTGEIAMAHIMS